ncbi:MAG TPA: GGDEF domain-containing protein [Planctomycetota bacterium]|nr:GGDEF domain-containing protein [Planctomycetota bacterium]
MPNIIEHLKGQSRFTIVRIAFWLAILLGIIDYATGPEIGFSIFYLLPISLVAWFSGILWAVVISFICSTIWFLSDSLGGHTYSQPAIGYWAANMRLGYFLIISYLLGTLEKMWVIQKHISNIDYLTGVANSRSFHHSADAELARAKRYSHSLTIAYIDVDNFKKINDLFGHSTGDNVLKLVAQTIGKNIRSVDIVGRLGGDEFCLLMPETGYESAQIALQKLRRVLLESMEEARWSITFSIGALTYATLPDNIDDIIIRADHLMYSVKNNGKNAIKHELVETAKANS